MKFAEAIGALLFNGNGWANTSLIQSDPLALWKKTNVAFLLQIYTLNSLSISSLNTSMKEQHVYFRMPMEPAAVWVGLFIHNGHHCNVEVPLSCL